MRHWVRVTKPSAFVSARIATCVMLLVGVSACKRDNQQGQQAGGASATASSPKLPLAASKALEEGNVAYRAKQLDVALVKYREAATAAPEHAAPWFGIYMAANEMKNTALADSAMVRVKSLSADPAALNAHAVVTAPNGGLDSAGGMPAGHPPTKLVMPSGHPAAPRTDSTKRLRM